VAEKAGQVLMKKTVELNKDVNQVAIGVPPERLAMLPKPNAGPSGGEGPKQDTPAPPPPATSSAALAPDRPVGPPEFAVAISREGECRPGGDCCYRMTVTNAGAGPWRGPIGLSDEMSFAPEALDIERSRPIWWCSQAGQTATCQRAAHARQGAIDRAAAMPAAAAPDVVGDAQMRPDHMARRRRPGCRPGLGSPGADRAVAARTRSRNRGRDDGTQD
jgi:hypothetical protein